MTPPTSPPYPITDACRPTAPCWLWHAGNNLRKPGWNRSTDFIHGYEISPYTTHWHPDSPTAPEPVKEETKWIEARQEFERLKTIVAKERMPEIYSKLPPCDHDECLPTRCLHTESAPDVSTPPQAQGTPTRMTAGWVPSYNDPDNASGAPVAEPITESEYIATLERKLAEKDAEIARIKVCLGNAGEQYSSINAAYHQLADAHAVTLAQLETATNRANAAEKDERLEAWMKVGGRLIALSVEMGINGDTGIETAMNVIDSLRAQLAGLTESRDIAIQDAKRCFERAQGLERERDEYRSGFLASKTARGQLSEANRIGTEELTALRDQLAAARKDSERLEWIFATLNKVGTQGFNNIVRWGFPGIDRRDIDLAIAGTTEGKK